MGAVLQQAGLVSQEQIQQALMEQRNGKNLRIGEILAAQGKINPKTADFFADRWSIIVQENGEEKKRQPLGQYLKQAALLDEKQIQTILNDQQQSTLGFGEMAIAKGWLKPQTVNFFLRYLVPELQCKKLSSDSQDSLKYSQKVHSDFLKIKLKLLNLETDGVNVYSEAALERILMWTGGQSLLTQKLFQSLSQQEYIGVLGQEAKKIDYLVKSKFLSQGQDQDQDLTNHFEGIRERLLHNQYCKSIDLLGLYQRILSETVYIDEDNKQQELLKMGLVVRQQDKLVVANLIYQSVFNTNWAIKESIKLEQQGTRPITSAITVVPETPLAVTSPIPRGNSFLKPRNILLFLAIIALLSVFLNNIAKRMAIKSAFGKGNALLQQQSFKLAVDQYTTLLNIDSNYFPAWTNRGYALAGLQKYEAMRESCSTATIIEPKAVYGWNCIGEALNNLKREKGAIAAFDRAIALDKTDAIFLINKSESLKALGQDEKSLAVIQEAINILEKKEAIKGKKAVNGEFAVALTFLGNGYRKKQQYEKAVNTYNRALEYSLNYFPAQIGKAIVLDKVRRYSEAKQEFTTILANTQLPEEQKSQAWFYFGETLCDSQQNLAGIRALEKAIKTKPDYKAAKIAKQRCSKKI